MDISGIIGDALRYPFSDWKKILIFGIIILISDIPSRSLGVTNNDLILLFVGIGFVAGFFVNGYLFRIIKSSLEGNVKLPEFNAWIDMFIDGVKVFMVFLIYLILPPLVILFLLLLFTGFDFTMLSYQFMSIFGSFGINPLEFLVSGILPGIENFVGILFNLFGELIALLMLFYVIIILPLFLVAIAGMAYEGELRSAFRFLEILEDIWDIGWINLIKWYVITGIIFLILFLLGNIIAYLLSFINFAVVTVLLSLILIPYSYMYYVRALALFYKPE